MSEVNEAPMEIEDLRAELDAEGIQYHHKAGVDTLTKLLNGEVLPAKPSKAKKVTVLDTPKLTAKQDALRLVRVIVRCNDPKKKDHTGDIFTVGDSRVGFVKKYIPYDNEEGWHIPNIIYQTMKNAECQVFVTIKMKNGQDRREGRLIKAFNIEVLDDLTPAELDKLAIQQKSRGSN